MPDIQTDHNERIAALRDEIETIRGQAQAMAEGRVLSDFTDEETAQLEEMQERIAYNESQIASRERLMAIAHRGDDGEAPPARRSAMLDGAGGGRAAHGGRLPGSQTSLAQMARRDPAFGFRSMGDFAYCVNRAGLQGVRPDERLANMAPTTWSNESAGADGGYLVPPEFSSTIMQYIGEQGSLFSLCEKTPVNSAIEWAVDQDAPWSTNGPTANWEGEAHQASESKVNLKPAGAKLNKLICLCPVSDELMADAPQFAAYLERTIGKKMRWKVDYGILNGTGAGMPLGVLKAPALKTVAKEGGQSADTINSTNIMKMWMGCFGDFRGRAVWVFNQDCEVQLMSMVVAGSSSDVPVYLPNGPANAAMAGTPQTTIMGRPAIPHQACQTLGDLGDIMLIDFSQYLIGYKTMGPVVSASIHLYFDYDLMAVKTVWRLTGLPLWSTTIAAANGSATYGPFVALAAR